MAIKTGNIESFEKIYKRLEEIVLANSGENEFEEIFKLVILHLWNEMHGEPDEYTVDGANQKLKLINSIWAGVLVETSLQMTEEHYRICVNCLKELSLFQDGFEGVDGLFEFLISKEKKGAKGQFFTPRHIVDFCSKVISPRKGEKILDPAAGSGAFLYHAYINGSDVDASDLWGIDFDIIATRVAKLLMNVAGLEMAHIYRLNSLIKANAVARGGDISTIEDVLRIEKKRGLFDVIMTNPPFAGEITEKEILDGYTVSRGKGKAERDVLFVERCISLLKPGGRMSIVLPDSIFGGRETEGLRRWINEKCRIVGVVGIPRNAFMPHTAVKTSILFLQRREKKDNSEENIFFGISERPGKDGRGNNIYKGENRSWSEIDHDLGEIETEFKKFIEKERIGW